MIQLELEMFFPLTEQIALDLDYSQTYTLSALWAVNYEWKETQWVNNITVNSNPIQLHPANDSAGAGYWKVGEGLQMHNKKRPSWLHQKMTKIFFDWEWKDNG